MILNAEKGFQDILGRVKRDRLQEHDKYINPEEWVHHFQMYYGYVYFIPPMTNL